MLTITIVSIAGITCAVWLANKVLPFKFCPICAGVAGTWLWMLGLHQLGYQIDLVIVAMLMGGSVVGIAYQAEKKLPAAKLLLLWKALFIPAGFAAVYSLVSSQWAMAAASLALAFALSWAFFKSSETKQPAGKVEELKKKMENCC